MPSRLRSCDWPVATSSQVGDYPVVPPPGDYVIGFSVNRKEDGVETSSDGYVRRYWREAANFAEATPVGSATPATITGIDAVLTPGAEVFPPSELTPRGTVTGTPATVLPTTKKKPLQCKKGFRKATKCGHARCVKIKAKAKKHQRPRKKVSHR